jgi:hypothetical protein
MRRSHARAPTTCPQVARRPTPISPPLVKYADLLCPVVESRRRATLKDNVRVTAFPSVPSSFPAQVSTPVRGWDPTPIDFKRYSSEAALAAAEIDANSPVVKVRISWNETSLIIATSIERLCLYHPATTPGQDGGRLAKRAPYYSVAAARRSSDDACPEQCSSASGALPVPTS